MKIAIIGYSGSGKSTLAKTLGQIFQAPVYHYDCIQFTQGWKERDRDEVKELVNESLSHSSWVIDGNYSAFEFDRRMSEANLIVFMNFPRRIAFPRVIKRYYENKGKTRDSIAEGCIEKIDLEFIYWCLIKGRSRKYTTRYKNQRHIYEDKFIECKNDKDVAKLIEQISK
ncbi:MAG: DNA topology modulation protein FlaR [Anaerorhabdus sp.]|uniref:DNA topology modulation protein FlaR n=1 Tax=Anaerorhabdus sp. TaxID=1872524 RepID=UPI002FC9577C